LGKMKIFIGHLRDEQAEKIKTPNGKIGVSKHPKKSLPSGVRSFEGSCCAGQRNYNSWNPFLKTPAWALPPV
jgi:hypothetical protein